MNNMEEREKKDKDRTPLLTLTQGDLMKLFSENWDHIRHMERYRILCLNIYAVILGGTAYVLSTGRVESLFSYIAAFLVFFTIINLLIAIKIEVVTNKFVEANCNIEHRFDDMEDFAPIRTRQGLWKFIRFQWIFPFFYGVSLIGMIAALIATWVLSPVIVGLLIFGVIRAIRGWIYRDAAVRMDRLADICAAGGIGLDESKESVLKWFDYFRRFKKGRIMKARDYIVNVTRETNAQQELREKARSFRDSRSDEWLWGGLSLAATGLFRILSIIL